MRLTLPKPRHARQMTCRSCRRRFPVLALPPAEIGPGVRRRVCRDCAPGRVRESASASAPATPSGLPSIQAVAR